MTKGNPISICSQSISSMSTVNPILDSARDVRSTALHAIHLNFDISAHAFK
jgi:hypothetical protein